MKISTRVLPFLLFFALVTTSIRAQLVVGTVSTAEELAESLVGGGVTISNVTLNCPGGAWGSFEGTGSNIGMDSGIILASGAITNAVGPNLSGSITTDYLAAGDADLDQLSGSETHDACVLEFDVVS